MTHIYNVFLGALDLLVRKAHLLIENENNNRSERFMNIVARFNMGKRLNLIQRGSYERRVHLSALSHNKSSYWNVSPWKTVTKKSPGYYFKKFMDKKDVSNLRNNKTKKNLFPSVSKKEKVPAQKNRDYGENAQQPEDADILLMECQDIIKKLQVFTLKSNVLVGETYYAPNCSYVTI